MMRVPLRLVPTNPFIKVHGNINLLPPPNSLLLFPSFATPTEQLALTVCARIRLDRAVGTSLNVGHFDRVINNYRECSLPPHSAWEDPSSSLCADDGIDPQATVSNLLPIARQVLLRARIAVAEALNRSFHWLPPHLLDVAQHGEIRAHIDNLAASGDIIAGISLLSPAIARFTPPPPPPPPPPTSQLTNVDTPKQNPTIVSATSIRGLPGIRKKESIQKPISKSTTAETYIEAFFPPGSLYVQSGPLRYTFQHEIIDQEFDWTFPTNDLIPGLSAGTHHFTRTRRISILQRSMIENKSPITS